MYNGNLLHDFDPSSWLKKYFYPAEFSIYYKHFFMLLYFYMKTFRFLVCTPPQNIELIILDLRSEVFSQYGYTSALALPVIIPLCPVNQDLSIKEIETILHSWRFSGFSISTSKIIDISGYLFYKLEENKNLTYFATHCKNLFLPDPEKNDKKIQEKNLVCIPFFNGFFLAKNEYNISIKELGINLPDIANLKFKHFFISLLQVNIYSNLNTWWENTDWEILIEVKSKKSLNDQNKD